MGGTRQPDPDDWSGPEDSGDPEDLGDDGLHDANNQLQPEDRPVGPKLEVFFCSWQKRETNIAKQLT